MRGFDNRFKGFPDYILGITKEIWEDRGLGGKMKDYYHPDVIVRTPGGIAFGEAGMTANTMANLVEFPDRQLLGEDVIWSGDTDQGLLSSHRILSTATDTGFGVFGRGTGKKLVYRGMADCFAHENMISDEWLIRDNGAIVRQIGQTPQDWAREQIAAEGGADLANPPFTPAVDKTGPYTGRGNDNEHGARLSLILSRMMQAEFSIIPREYDRACHLECAGGITGHSWAAADAFWLPLRSAMPNATFKLHHQIGRDDPMMPPRAAVRWSLTGTHDGWGAFGAPSGAELYIMGATHAEFGPRGLRREFTIYDETAVWKQILLHTG